MTAITDTKLIIETLLGRSVVNAKLATIVDNILSIDEESTLKNEEKAQQFLDRLKHTLREQNIAGAIRKKMRENAPEVNAIRTAAETDLE